MSFLMDGLDPYFLPFPSEEDNGNLFEILKQKKKKNLLLSSLPLHQILMRDEQFKLIIIIYLHFHSVAFVPALEGG
jgi:hypothetical protein